MKKKERPKKISAVEALKNVLSFIKISTEILQY